MCSVLFCFGSEGNFIFDSILFLWFPFKCIHLRGNEEAMNMNYPSWLEPVPKQHCWYSLLKYENMKMSSSSLFGASDSISEVKQKNMEKCPSRYSYYSSYIDINVFPWNLWMDSHPLDTAIWLRLRRYSMLSSLMRSKCKI